MFEDRGAEDPLAGLGSTSGTATVAPSGQADAPLGSSGAEPRERRLTETPMLLLWALVTLAIAAYVLQRSEHTALHDPLQKAARGNITASSHGSLVRPANLGHVLRKLKAEMKAGETVTDMRIDPTKVNATVKDRFGRTRLVDIDLAYHATSRKWSDTTSKGIPIAAIDPAGPARELATIRRTVHGGRLDYVVVNVASDHAGSDLNMFLTGDVIPRNKQWMADGHGRDVRRPGEPGAAQRALQHGITASALRRAKRILIANGQHVGCVRKAKSIEALQGCLR